MEEYCIQWKIPVVIITATMSLTWVGCLYFVRICLGKDRKSKSHHLLDVAKIPLLQTSLQNHSVQYVSEELYHFFIPSLFKYAFQELTTVHVQIHLKKEQTQSSIFRCVLFYFSAWDARQLISKDMFYVFP